MQNNWFISPLYFLLLQLLVKKIYPNWLLIENHEVKLFLICYSPLILISYSLLDLAVKFCKWTITESPSWKPNITFNNWIFAILELDMHRSHTILKTVTTSRFLESPPQPQFRTISRTTEKTPTKLQFKTLITHSCSLVTMTWTSN